MTDLDRLKVRVTDYFNRELSHGEITRRYPAVMDAVQGFDPSQVRVALLVAVEARLRRASFPMPIDHLIPAGSTGKRIQSSSTQSALTTSRMCSRTTCGCSVSSEDNVGRPVASPLQHPFLETATKWNGSARLVIPAWLRDDGLEGGPDHRRPNLSPAAQRYLERLGVGVEDLFNHVLAVLHDPAYREANAGALRMEWPRIPLPGWPDGNAPGAAEELAASAARGRELAALLDSDTPVPGVTTGALRPETAAIAVPATVDGGNMTGDDFALTAGWGHFGQGEAVMPGQGRVVERPYTSAERAALGDAAATLGDATLDVYLNDRAYWRNVPAAVWSYKLGGYQVLKKWLSYRERKVLGRPLSPEEVQHFTDTARRIGAVLGMV